MSQTLFWKWDDELTQFLWYVTHIVRKLAWVAALQLVAIRRVTGNDVVATSSPITFFLLFFPLFPSVATFDKVFGLICHRHCRKIGWYSDTVILICHTHCQKIWQGSWPDMSRTLSENGMIQWHSLPDSSHALSENWMIWLSWCIKHIARKLEDMVVLMCHTHCQKILHGSWLDMSQTLLEKKNCGSFFRHPVYSLIF